MESTNEEKYKAFSDQLEKSKHLVIMTGAGVSAESGIPTFRGEGGLFRKHNAQKIATPSAFKENPSLVWQFYQYRRNVVQEKSPNKGHEAIVKIEKNFLEQGKKFCLITQNVDGFHKRAGSKNVIEMHGKITETRCTKCGHVEENTEKLVNADSTDIIPENELPRCKINNCGGLLRPNVVWFEEPIDPSVYIQIENELNKCDFFIIVGTSSIVYPAAYFSEIVADRYVPIAEFNIEDRPTSRNTLPKLYIKGKSAETLPEFLLGEKPY